MRNFVRLLMSGFLVLLLIAAVAGFQWWGARTPEPASLAVDGRPVLAVGIVAGLIGLWAIWKYGPRGGSAR